MGFKKKSRKKGLTISMAAQSCHSTKTASDSSSIHFNLSHPLCSTPVSTSQKMQHILSGLKAGSSSPRTIVADKYRSRRTDYPLCQRLHQSSIAYISTNTSQVYGGKVSLGHCCGIASPTNQ